MNDAHIPHDIVHFEGLVWCSLGILQKGGVESCSHPDGQSFRAVKKHLSCSNLASVTVVRSTHYCCRQPLACVAGRASVLISSSQTGGIEKKKVPKAWIVIEGRCICSIRAVLPPECLVWRKVWYMVTLVKIVVSCEVGVKSALYVWFAEPPLGDITTDSVDVGKERRSCWLLYKYHLLITSPLWGRLCIQPALSYLFDRLQCLSSNLSLGCSNTLSWEVSVSGSRKRRCSCSPVFTRLSCTWP